MVASISEAHLENVRDQCRDSPAISIDQFVELLATAIARFDYKCDDSSIPVVLKALKEVLDVNMELYNLHQKALVSNVAAPSTALLINKFEKSFWNPHYSAALGLPGVQQTMWKF